MVEVPDSTTKYVDSDTGKPTKDLFNWMKSISSSLASLDSAWVAYTPIITAGLGTLTSVSVSGSRYKQIGKTVFLQITVNITTNGTGANWLYATLPVNATGSATFAGREVAVTGKPTMGQIFSPTQLTFLYYDGTYPGGNGTTNILGGFYEAA